MPDVCHTQGTGVKAEGDEKELSTVVGWFLFDVRRTLGSVASHHRNISDANDEEAAADENGDDDAPVPHAGSFVFFPSRHALFRPQITTICRRQNGWTSPGP